MEIISNLKDNPAIFYNYARKKAVVQSSIGPLKNARGEMCLDRLEMSNLLSDQYYSIGQDPFIHPDDPAFLAGLDHDGVGLSDLDFDPTIVKGILEKLTTKAGPGPDGIPPHCLKFGGPTILNAVVDLGRMMVEEGVIPEDLKGTWVTPIWKGTNKEDPADYRPIAITNHIMKVLEKVIRVQIVDFLSGTGFLDDQQHGGRALRSTLSQL